MTRLTKTVDLSDHALGPQDARVTLVEYGSYDCPHCRQALAITLALLTLAQENGPSLRLIYRHFPREAGASPSQRAAEAAEAAGEQGRFWEMHEHLLKNQHALDDANLLAYTVLLGLDVARFAAAMEEGVYHDQVLAMAQSGVASGVLSTPTFFINGVRHDDHWDLDTLRAAIVAAAA
ncbi:MAG: oxidoreductase [Chthonomonadaceae bacterium]|nr:oxidoreductase [Chthonomonadaceae bacterium]